MSNEELKQNLTSVNQWVRVVYMVLFAVLLEVAGFVMLAVVIAQFLFAIFSGAANDSLRRLGDQIASYIYQSLQFLIYNTEEKPFPFSEWPESDVEDLSSYESAEEVDGEVIGEEEVVESESEESSVIELGAEDVVEEPAAKEQSESKAKSQKDVNRGKKSEAARPEVAEESEAGEAGQKTAATDAGDAAEKSANDK